MPRRGETGLYGTVYGSPYGTVSSKCLGKIRQELYSDSNLNSPMRR